MIVSFEGIDGTGKTTQTKLVAEVLRNIGLSVLVADLRTAIGNKIKSIILDKENHMIDGDVETMLYLAVRKQYYEEVMKSAEADIILIDRWLESTIVYQGNGSNEDFIRQINDRLSLPQPHLTFLFDISPEMAEKRISNKDKDRFESMPRSFFHNIRNKYLKIAEGNPRFVMIDAEDTQENITQKIVESIVQLIHYRLT